MAELAVQ